MIQNTKKAILTIQLLSQYAVTRRLCTALFANQERLYADPKVYDFLSLHDCLFPYAQKHPYSHREAEQVYRKAAEALSLKHVKPLRYETVYCELGKIRQSNLTNLSLTLPIFEDENEYIIYSPKNDTYQYGFYHYGKLREGFPMEICPAGHLLIRLEKQKEKRPLMLLAGDAFAPFLVSYMAHHFDICLHAPLESALLLSKDLSRLKPDVFMLLGGVTLLENTVLQHALYQ